MRKSKSTQVFAGVAMSFLLSACVNGTVPTDTWRLVYAHSGDGSATEGSKEDLIKAIRHGREIRVYWSGRRVEHVANADFLTILEGEVFAQIHSIRGQSPSIDPPKVVFREPEIEWTTIHATNGDRSLKWFAHH